MTIVFHARLHGRFIEIQSNLWRKKLYRTNQSSNFLGGSFSNRDSVRATPMQFTMVRQPKHLKRWFFLKNRPINFHLNSTSVIRPVKQNQLSFKGMEFNKPPPAPSCLFPLPHYSPSTMIYLTATPVFQNEINCGTSLCTIILV